MHKVSKLETRWNKLQLFRRYSDRLEQVKQNQPSKMGA